MKQILPIGRGYCLSNIKRHLSYTLLINIGIIWLLSTAAQAQTQRRTITGSVISASDGKPLQGATIKLKQGGRGVLTGKDGSFSLATPIIKGTLTVTNIGYKSTEALFNIESQNNLVIRLEPDDNSLDEVQVIGYGQVSKRFNTGSVVTVTAQEIERQPVSNPLAALAGRVPGMTVEQTNGNPGAKINIQIRGQNSISQGSQPLFIIDGIPFSNDYVGTGDIVAGNGGQSPFSNIVPGDIKQIDVLKDADATAIYGSRGANGVVLITTKKGQAGATTVNASVYQGAGQITRRLDLLNTRQYVEMRKEAFINDGIEPTAVNAPDLVLWDTTRYTDWQKSFIGGTAHFTNADVSLSAGNANTQILFSSNYYRQTTVYPGDFGESRGTGRMNISHTSSDHRFKALIASSYSMDKNQLPGDLTYYINLPPNNPNLFDSDGNLVWSENGGTFMNPLSSLFTRSTALTDNFIGNLNIQYEVFKNFQFRLTGGYNFLQFNESYLNPKSSLDPNNSTLTSSSKFANTTSKSWIAEPQIEYLKDFGKGSLDVLLGGTIQNSIQNLFLIEASDFPNDALLEATSFAKNVNSGTSKAEYRYQAVFGRINYNFRQKYLLNITGRRDGSSRFGPNKRIANFGAIGAAWIFNEEKWLKDHASWLSYGKLRSSYGVTGNDQIGDYQYLDNYGATTTQYQGQVGYMPSRLFNADYTWERNRKLETALELGAVDNKILLTVNWFRTRSDNQLVNYKLPDQTGFSYILRNFDALVQNSGWEFLLTVNPIKKELFNWDLSANLTLSRNKLLKFPGLESSSYANTLVIGYPLTIEKYLKWTGVDPNTGIHSFEGIARPDDQTQIADFSPTYYGSVSNIFRYKGWDFGFLLQYNKQQGVSYITSFGGAAPGTRYNQPVEVLDRWQHAGDEKEVQKFTTMGEASTAYSNYSKYSDGRISDASFIRLKNIYLSYTLPRSVVHSTKTGSLRIYFQGQNMFTLTSFKGMDPETGGSVLPPLTVYSIGIQLSR